jgi:hypothetical protein
MAIQVSYDGPVMWQVCTKLNAVQLSLHTSREQLLVKPWPSLFIY